MFIKGEMLEDLSTSEAFCFSLRCGECGEVWNSTPVRFSKSGILPETEGKRVIFETLYRKEKDAARERAAAEAVGVFNVCPICHRVVCDRCFLICDDLDLCCSCADCLEEKGESVESR